MKIKLDATVLKNLKNDIKKEMMPKIAYAVVADCKMNITNQVDINDNIFTPWKVQEDLFITIKRQKILLDTGKLRNSIRAENINNFKFNLIADKPYAEIQNYGGTINQTQIPTDSQRKMFWAKYYATKKDKYKAMALSKILKIKITIPKREYLGIGTKTISVINRIITKFVKEKSSKK